MTLIYPSRHGVAPAQGGPETMKRCALDGLEHLNPDNGVSWRLLSWAKISSERTAVFKCGALECSS